tara:strand:- start:3328 stop:3558 length:231 start_codon:yes stop_codon:yes gene_type:complete
MGRLQLYALLATTFVLGLLGIYSAGVAKGQDKIKRKLDARRIHVLKSNKEITDEVSEMDDTDLADRARNWVRSDHE